MQKVYIISIKKHLETNPDLVHSCYWRSVCFFHCWSKFLCALKVKPDDGFVSMKHLNMLAYSAYW